MTKITPNSLPSLTICSRLPFVAHSMTFGTRSKSVVAQLHFTSRLCWSNLTCCQVLLGTGGPSLHLSPPSPLNFSSPGLPSPPPASLPCMAQSFGYCSLGSHDPLCPPLLFLAGCPRHSLLSCPVSSAGHVQLGLFQKPPLSPSYLQ